MRKNYWSQHLLAFVCALDLLFTRVSFTRIFLSTLAIGLLGNTGTLAQFGHKSQENSTVLLAYTETRPPGLGHSISPSNYPNRVLAVNKVWEVKETFTLRLNAGHLTGDVYVDGEGNTWENDGYYTKGRAYPPVPSGPYNQLKEIEFIYTDRHHLYRSERIGLGGWEYEIPVENGKYIVKLHFAELYWRVLTTQGGPGSRVFDVYLEDEKVLGNYDMLTMAGPRSAIEELFEVDVEDGVLNIQGFPIVDQAKISAIEVFGADGTIHVKQNLPQSNYEGENVDLAIVAFGGQGNLGFSATGLPEGLTIDPATGNISGQIASGAASQNEGGYEAAITVSDGNTTVNTTVAWTVFGEIPDQWSGIENETEHIARHENSFTQVGNKFYLLGGRESDLVEIYDPATKTWSQGAAAPVELNHFQAIGYQGLLWVIGAFKDNDFPNEQPAGHIYIYDPVTDKWAQGPEIPEGRRRGSAGLVVYNDKFYVASGIQNGHTDGWVPWFDEYDPVTNTWTELPDAPRARDHFHAVVVGNRLYVTGGRRSGEAGVFAPLVPEVDVYDFLQGEWLSGGLPENIPTPRAGASSVNFRGEVLVIGGEGTESGPAFQHTEALNVKNGQWRRLADMVTARHGTQAIVSGPGIFTTAGSPQRGGGNMDNMEVYGLNEPRGAPVVASNLTAPASVGFENSTEEKSIVVQNTSGNQALYISSIELEGAGIFEITGEGNLAPGVFIIPGGRQRVNIRLTSVPDVPTTASLVITYGAGKEVSITLVSDAEDLLLEVDAGQDRIIFLPVTNIELEATISGGGDAEISYEWVQESGPAQASLSGADTGTLTASDLIVGEYIFSITVTGSGGVTATDEVKVTLRADGLNVPLNVSATKGESEDNITVVWDEVSGATHYQVYRSQENDAATATAISDWVTVTNFEDPDVETGKVYYYFLRAATDDSGENISGFSDGDLGFLKASGDSPAISLSGNLNFGMVAVGQDSIKTLTITNSGGADLEVTSIEYPEGFSGDWEGGAIGPLQSVEVAVAFSPLEEIEYSGEIIINSNAETGPASIQVTGQGGDGVPTGTGKKDISHTVVVYPNPVQDNFNIRLENDLRGPVQVRVMNAVGQQIKSYGFFKDAHSLEWRMDAAWFPNGLYMVEISMDGHRAVKRVNKQ